MMTILKSTFCCCFAAPDEDNFAPERQEPMQHPGRDFLQEHMTKVTEMFHQSQASGASYMNCFVEISRPPATNGVTEPVSEEKEKPACVSTPEQLFNQESDDSEPEEADPETDYSEAFFQQDHEGDTEFSVHMESETFPPEMQVCDRGFSKF